MNTERTSENTFRHVRIKIICFTEDSLFYTSVWGQEELSPSINVKPLQESSS